MEQSRVQHVLLRHNTPQLLPYYKLIPWDLHNLTITYDLVNLAALVYQGPGLLQPVINF